MTEHRKKIIFSIVSLSLAASFVLSSCGGSTPAPATEAATTTTAAETTSASTTEAATSETTSAGTTTAADTNDPEPEMSLVGSPWPTSILSGNITVDLPDRNDDMYMYYNYDFLKENEGSNVTKVAVYSGDISNGVVGIMADETKTSDELEQLRLFFSQAADTETLVAQGNDEIIPYIEKIKAVSSIEEMNALLSAEDFPFSPFITAINYYAGKENGNLISLYPNFLFVDPVLIGGQYYENSNDPANSAMIRVLESQVIINTMADIPLIGIEAAELNDYMTALLNFEIQYGQYAEYEARYGKLEYGAYAEELKKSVITPDELEKLCTSFPIKGILANQMKDSSDKYLVLSRKWLEVLNDLWTDENIEIIKLMAEMKVLNETRPYRDNSALNAVYESYGLPAADPMTFAYNACNSIDTFSHLIAKLYVTECIDPKANERITALTKELVDTYKKLINETKWIDENTKAGLVKKLDSLSLNILSPISGYYDYSSLKLVPASEGGTLFGNYLILKKYRAEQELKLLKSSTPLQSTWYFVRPTDINCFYDVLSNSINILPGYVTSFIYNDAMDEETLLGGIGVVVGHEISHGFDFSGSQFDGNGDPLPVYSENDMNIFLAKCGKIADYYSSFEVEPDISVNGQMVKVEATADLSGVQAVLAIAENRGNVDIDRLVDAMADIYSQVITKESLVAYTSDSHPLNHYRVNANLQMFDIIYKTFGITEDDGMYLAPEDRIVLWGNDAA